MEIFKRVGAAEACAAMCGLGLLATVSVAGAAATAYSTPHLLSAPYTGAFIDTEANFNSQPVSYGTTGGEDPSQYAGNQFQTTDVSLLNDDNTSDLLIGMTVNDNDGDDLSVHSPSGPIAPGMYSENMTSFNYFSFSRDDTGCSTNEGDIDISEISYSGSKVTSFAATFEVHCQLLYGATSNPAIFGDISYNSTEPFYGADLSTDVAEMSAAGLAPSGTDVTVTNTGQSVLNPTAFSIGGSDPGDFAISFNACQVALQPGSSCALEISYDPSGEDASDTAVLQFYDQLAVDDPSGQAGLGSGRHILLYGSSYNGYLDVHRSGVVDTFGDAPFLGQPSQLNQPIVGTSATPDGGGYWLVASDGGIFSYGDAAFYGSTGGIHLNQPIVGMAPTPDGGGYWLVASDGGIFSYGDAAFYGSTGGIHLNQPIVGMAPTPDGGGYWLVASDGGIFSYGDAAFYGSTGGMHLNQPIVGMASTPDGDGYWMVASDGGIFSYGDAAFYGSTGSIHLNRPIVGMAATPDGEGYWLVASDGGIFTYGDAPFLGSSAASGRDDVVGISGLFPT